VKFDDLLFFAHHTWLSNGSKSWMTDFTLKLWLSLRQVQLGLSEVCQLPTTFLQFTHTPL
jgi:hypothetical protein